ncbi:hypothetical protein ABZ686_01005 [Streptomyces sp. NPDC006992]|uniref:hypothetical protein n=1 Tax=Streptomyces sp. NPDC006992 TaxID=3155601 RepID=UPI00340005FD
MMSDLMGRRRNGERGARVQPYVHFGGSGGRGRGRKLQAPLLGADGGSRDEAVVPAPLFDKRKRAVLQIAGSDQGFAPTRSRQFTPLAAGVPLLLK